MKTNFLGPLHFQLLPVSSAFLSSLPPDSLTNDFLGVIKYEQNEIV